MSRCYNKVNDRTPVAFKAGGTETMRRENYLEKKDKKKTKTKRKTIINETE